MKKIVIGLVSVLSIVNFSGCSKSPVCYEKVLKDKYTIDRYIEESLDQDEKNPQVYRDREIEIFNPEKSNQQQEYANCHKKLKNEIKNRHKVLKTICSNQGGNIVNTTHNLFRKFHVSNNIKSCKVKDKELFIYSISDTYDERGANLYIMYKMVLIKLTEKNQQEVIVDELIDKQITVMTQKNCNVDYFSNKVDELCKIENFSQKEKCMIKLSDSIYKNNSCQDKNLLQKFNQKISEIKEYDRLNRKCNDSHYSYILGIEAKAACKVDKMVALGGNKPFNWGQCITNHVKKDRAICSKYKK